MTGYKASKNQKYYYKCNKRGCKNNQRAEEVNSSFEEILSYLSLEEKYQEPLKLSLAKEFEDISKEITLKQKELKSNLTSIETKLEKLEEKYLFEGVSQEVYHKHLKRLTDDKNEITKELEKPEIELSNLDKFINYSVETSPNILNIWKEGNYENKVNIQNMLFPEGIRYNRKKQHYRTQRINLMFILNTSFSKAYRDKNKKRETILNDFPSQVVPHGLV